MDNNVVYMNSATGNSFYGYYGNTNQATRAAFQAATGVLNFEQNSSDADPLFVNAANANFRPSNLLIDNMGTNVFNDVPVDFFGAARTITPDPGAIEFMVSPLDAGVVDLVNPAGIACAGNLNVEVRVRNFGTDTLTAVSVDWEVNSTAQPTQVFTGLQVLPGQDTVLTLGIFTFQTGLAYTFKAWTFAPNNGVDASPINDTLNLILNPGMIGTYTVNSTQPVSAVNYHSVVDVMSDLNQRGVCGAVIVDIVNAIENAQLLVGPIVGTSATNTVTFRSQAQDSTAVTLAANSTLLATNYVFRFSNAAWINLEHLTLTNIGRVLDFTGNNQNIRVSNCVLLSDTVSPGTSNIRTPVYSNLNTPFDENITIANNRIVGGAFGVYWYGSATQANESGNRFVGNVFRQQNLRAAEFRYQQSLEFSGNDLLIAYNSTATTFGVYVQDGGNNLRMDGNYMLGSGEHPNQSIRIENSPASAVTPAILSNNMLISGDQNTVSTLFHFHLTNSPQLRLFHNSGTFNNPSNGSGVVFADNMADFHMVNNNFASTNGNVAGYIYSSSIPVVSDYNNFFAGATASTLWFNNNIPVADLLAWQTTTALDANSVSVDPQYFSATDLRTCAPALDGAGTPLASVTTDIDGNLRDAATPDIGATEFAAQPTVDLGSDITKCANVAVTIGGQISGVTGYSWSTGATTASITVQTPGTYTLTATGVCGSASDAIQVIDLPLPQALFTPVNIDPQVNFNNLSTGNGLTYVWDFGDGNQSTDENPVHIYQQDGLYTVTLTVTDSCGITSNASASVTIGNTNIDEENGLSLNVWPNPTSDWVNITWNVSLTGTVFYQLQDMTGRVVLEKSDTSLHMKLDLSALPSGNYLLKMEHKGSVYRQKVIKY
jgi:PKD repeat protein